MSEYHYAAVSLDSFNEDAFEGGVLEYLCDELGYERLYGPEVPRSNEAFDDAFLPDVIEPALSRINPSLPRCAIEAAIVKLKEIEGGSLVAKNKAFMDMLQNGVEVRFFDRGEERAGIVRLIDFDRPGRNEFHAVNQWT